MTNDTRQEILKAHIYGKTAAEISAVVGGTLTPTDPPVPIPALPTIQGETIIDYNPSTTPAVEPEKMYIKYKPQ